MELPAQTPNPGAGTPREILFEGRLTNLWLKAETFECFSSRLLAEFCIEQQVTHSQHRLIGSSRETVFELMG